jgi:hypothetical protein
MGIIFTWANFMKAVVWKAGPESIPVVGEKTEWILWLLSQERHGSTSLRVDNSEEGEQSSY